MQEIIIIGAGGNSKVIIDIISAINKKLKVDKGEDSIKVIGILDDDDTKKDFEGFSVLGTISKVKVFNETFRCGFINGIGDNQIRKKVYSQYIDVKWITIAHPSAIISANAKIGTGCLIMPGAIINSGASIGKQALINSGAIVEHDNNIGDFVHLASGTVTAGSVTIGEGTMLGTGTKVMPKITIGKNSIIGAGAVVITDIPDNCTAVGVPAKVIKTHK